MPKLPSFSGVVCIKIIFVLQDTPHEETIYPCSLPCNSNVGCSIPFLQKEGFTTTIPI
jgi:hypothetical protein